MLTTEQLYVKALKKQMVVWRRDWTKNGWTEDRLGKMMQEFVSNEKLCAEIVRISLLMSGDVGNEDDILEMIGDTFELIESLMRQFPLDMPVVWRYLMDGVRYGTDEDPMNIHYDIASVKRKIRNIPTGDTDMTVQNADDDRLRPRAELRSLLLQMQSL